MPMLRLDTKSITKATHRAVDATTTTLHHQKQSQTNGPNEPHITRDHNGNKRKGTTKRQTPHLETRKAETETKPSKPTNPKRV
ncbi:hypothetical protein AALP_AAs41097U000300 [Arabis alpina]|uniref:Uncharacterized protein n=1 Tax=Arabis alpina TaxID=50452 RepID=A0A087G0U8_ARAAL|nr:hypothetical protein AALP_AAs41097U000300 [Arabis alpina]